jgi:hypothetical protein
VSHIAARAIELRNVGGCSGKYSVWPCLFVSVPLVTFVQSHVS